MVATIEGAPPWASCTAHATCIGIQARPDGPCLAHLDEAGLRAALERIHEQGTIDVRGVEFSDSLLKRVLEAFSKGRAGRPGFKVSANFEKATFAGNAADFRRTTFAGNTGFGGAIFKGNAWFTDATFENGAWFSEATFQGDAWFTEVTVRDGRAYFDKATFQGDAWFTNAKVFGRASFVGATFRGGTEFRGATIQGNAMFSGTTFEQTSQFGPLHVRHGLSLDGAIFRQRVRLEVAASKVSCSRTRFLAGVHLRLRWAQVMLEDASLAGLSILSSAPAFRDLDESEMLTTLNESEMLPTWRGKAGPPRPDGRPWLASLCRADVSGLAVASVDLQACRFDGAHNLDQLRLESPKAFATTPGWHAVKGWAWPPAWWWTRRQTLAEEHTWRVRFEHGVRQANWHAGETWPKTTGHWAPKPSRPPKLTGTGTRAGKTPFHLGRLWRLHAEHTLRRREEVQLRQERAREIANLYRALRKGYEDNRNEPGAADFYYGEMELRREATPPSIERVILWLYWLVSGYGLRAWRALASAAGSLVLGALLLETVGFDTPHLSATTPGAAADTSFFGALIYGARTVIGLPNDPQPPLTRWGDLLQIGLRITVPVLLGLAVLSIRGRVKR